MTPSGLRHLEQRGVFPPSCDNFPHCVRGRLIMREVTVRALVVHRTTSSRETRLLVPLGFTRRIVDHGKEAALRTGRS